MNENLDKSDSVHRVLTEVKSLFTENHPIMIFVIILYVYYDLIYRKITDFEQI